MSSVTVPATEGVGTSGVGGPVRFLWVDAIRGRACMAVVMRHLGFPVSNHAGLVLLFPQWLLDLHAVSAAGCTPLKSS